MHFTFEKNTRSQPIFQSIRHLSQKSLAPLLTPLQVSGRANIETIAIFPCKSDLDKSQTSTPNYVWESKVSHFLEVQKTEKFWKTVYFEKIKKLWSHHHYSPRGSGLIPKSPSL